MTIRRLTLADAAETALVYRASYDARMPWLAGRHTAEEDLVYFRTVALAHGEAWGFFESGALAGFIAFDQTGPGQGFVEKLYVSPLRQGCGVGRALLELAMQRFAGLQLWTFERNHAARRFYERNGFVAVERTDGMGTEEREPDIRYAWRRG